jgi:hypothetical protein
VGPHVHLTRPARVVPCPLTRTVCGGCPLVGRRNGAFLPYPNTNCTEDLFARPVWSVGTTGGTCGAAVTRDDGRPAIAAPSGAQIASNRSRGDVEQGCDLGRAVALVAQSACRLHSLVQAATRRDPSCRWETRRVDRRGPRSEACAHGFAARPPRMLAHPLGPTPLGQPKQFGASRRPFVRPRCLAEGVEPVSKRGQDPVPGPGPGWRRAFARCVGPALYVGRRGER